MKAHEIERFKEELAAFLAEIVSAMGRSERRRYTEMYIQGLLMDGERKSIEPMANRIPDGNIQALQQFVNQSPWSHQEVRRLLAQKVEREVGPEASWIIDETSFPKKGKHSVGVAYQYCGALGKTANCQVAVTLDMGTEELSIPLNWALYLPKEWINDQQPRERCGVPKDTVFKTKVELALDLVDEVRSWGLKERLVLADSLDGDSYDFRSGLKNRHLDYIVQVEGKLLAWTDNPHPPKPLRKKGGKIPRQRLYAKDLPPAITLKEIAKGLPGECWPKVKWREGTKGALSSRFARIVVWLANGLVQGKRMKVEPEELLVEWPESSDSPTKFWLSSLSPTTPWRDLVRRAKGRFRVEQDYQEMKRELGLDHFEGRSFQGWHHHVTLVAMAYAFLMFLRLGNKKTSGLTLPALRRWLQKLLLMYTGISPTCGKKTRKINPKFINDS